HLDNLFIVAENKNIVVNASFPEFILDDGNSLTVPLLKDAVEQCGLSRAEKAGEDRNRHFIACGGSHCFNICVDPNEPTAKRLAISCSLVVTPLAIKSFSAALSHCW